MTREEQLIMELKGGSRAAFNEIFQLYAARLYVFCHQFCKSAEEAEEIVNDTFLKLWLNRESIRNEDTLRPLLFVTSRRLLINAYRRRVNSLEYASYLELTKGATESDGRSDHWIEYDDFVRRLNAAIATLPPTQQKIIRMSKIEGMSNKEIQVELGLSQQTVKNQLSVALKTLREKMGLLFFLFFF